MKLSGKKTAAAIGLGVVIVAAFVTIVITLIDPPDAAPRAYSPVGAAAAGVDRDLNLRSLTPQSAMDLGTPSDSGAAEDGVAGVVRTRLGRPAARAEVQLMRATRAWPELGLETVETTVCSTDGTFRFATPRARDLYLSATESREAIGEFGSAVVEVHPAAKTAVLTLSQGFRVAGTVLDPNGQPLAECRVVLAPDADERLAEWTRTDASGEFLFRRVAGGVVRVEARHDYYRPVSRRITVGSFQRHTLRFERSAVVLEGRVLELVGGAPVAGAEVHVLPNEVNRNLHHPDSVRTDPNGEFKLLGQAPGNRWIEVRHPDFSTVSRVVQVSERPPSLDFELVGRTEVSGRLIGPVSGAERLLLRGRGGEIARAAVDAMGRFAFKAPLSVGSVTLELEEGELAFGETRRRELTISLEERDQNRLEIVVEPASLVVGVVKGPDGAPVAGVTLSAAPPNRDAGGSILGWALERLTDLDRAFGTRNSQSVLAVSDPQGRFRVAGLPQGEIGLLMDGGDLARHQIVVPVPESGQVFDAGEVILRGGGSITGVVQRTGVGRPRPVGGAYVFVSTAATGLVSAISGNDGRFVLSRLAPGSYRVRARFSNFPTARSPGVVTVREGEQTEVDLEFPAGRKVRGEVLGGDGEPVAGAVVMVSGTAGTEVRSEADGSFELEAPLSEVEVWAHTEDRQIETFAFLAPGQDQITLHLATRPTGGVRGTVQFTASHRPAVAGVLRVLRRGGDGGMEFVRGVSMPAGRLDMTGIPEGPVRLILHCAGAAPAVMDVSVEAGSVVDLGAIWLEPGSTLAGVVRDAAGRPVAGATVYLGELVDRTELTRAGATPALQTDAEGLFELSGVAWCARQLVVSAPGHAVSVTELDLPRDVLRVDPLVVQLGVGSELSIDVVDANGEPWERGFVQLSQGKATLAVRPVGEGGRVSFAHLGPGRYELAILGRSAATQVVEVEAGRPRYAAQIVVH